MKDAKGHVIYIGKAVSLKNRVRSYFQKGAKGEKTEMMVRQIADLETIDAESTSWLKLQL